MADLIDQLADNLPPTIQRDFNAFMVDVEERAKSSCVKLTAKRTKLLQTELAVKDETAEPVIGKIYRPGQVEADPLHGRYSVPIGGKQTVVEYLV